MNITLICLKNQFGYIEGWLFIRPNMEEDFDDSHLPFSMPTRNYKLSQEWRNLAFLHWIVDESKLKQYIPHGLEIDTFEGNAYIGLVPFKMTKVRPRGLPSVPIISNFPEFNIRTYVVKDGIPGVLFLTLEAKSLITCFHAPRAYGLPYNYAKGFVRLDNTSLKWHSSRNYGRLTLTGETTPFGEKQQAKSGSLEEFLFERYCLYTEHKNCLKRAYTYHKKWSFYRAEAKITENSLTESYDLGIDNALSPDYVHFSRGVKVKTWTVEVAERIGVDKNRDFLFLDGDCGLCHRLAFFIDHRIGKHANLGYRPNTSPDAKLVINSLPDKLQKVDSVYLIRNGKPYIRSAAAIRCLLYMKWYYRMWYPLCWFVPLPIRDIAYRLVANFRHRIFKRPSSCTFRID